MIEKNNTENCKSDEGACSCEHEHHQHNDHEHHTHEGACSCHDEHSDGCGCGHNHGEIEEDSIRKKTVIFAISAVIFALGFVVPDFYNAKLILFIISYLIVGAPVLKTAGQNILKGKIFDENFLMTIATIGAFFVGEYPEAAAVMLFYNVGELLSDIAVNRSRTSISALLDIRPDYANVLRDGTEVKIDPQEAEIDDIILVRPGDRIPLDGVILEGEGFVDNSALTGESMPVSVEAGNKILSGGISKSGLLKIRVTSTFANSTINRILHMVEEASEKKAQTERFITRFAARYTPFVVITAVIIAILPPALGFGAFTEWLYRALTFLVVSCPCALVVSIPIGFFGGIGKASKQGVLIKGGNFLEILSNMDTVVFDKTGTLTTGKLRVQNIITKSENEKSSCLQLAASAERYSNHPAASAILSNFDGELLEVQKFEELSGRGVKATIENKILLCGNLKLMNEFRVENVENQVGTVIYVAYDSTYIGAIVISDTVKPEAKEALIRLKKLGVRKTVMLTGDTEAAAKTVADEVGIDSYHAGLMPDEKVSILSELIKTKKSNGAVVFVGDGINDAPVLKTADVGVAMGTTGADAAIEAADIVIMTDKLTKLSDAVETSRETKKIVMQNIVFALGIKTLVMIATFFGLSNMWEAVFADVGVTVLAVLNSTRILTIKSPKKLSKE